MRNGGTALPGRFHFCAARAFGLILGLLAIAFLALQFATSARAVLPDEMLSDAKLEARARTLSRELRCMVCQNQSIDDSEAPLARDLRILVRERLKAGDSDSQVLDFLTARYGAFVLLKPPFAWNTLLLWLAPACVLILGVLLLFGARRRGLATPAEAVTAEPSLSASEQKRLARLLASQAGERAPDARG